MGASRQVEILVTGANGWLGKGLINALLNGIEGVPGLPTLSGEGMIRALVLPGDTLEFFSPYSERVEVVSGDLRNPEDCQRLMQDAQGASLFHTAGIIHPSRVSEFYQINLEGTRNLLGAAQESGVRRVVIVSSNSPVGCNPTSDHLFDELSPFNPYMNYGRSKMLMERAVVAIQDAGKLETVRIRAPWFYGPFQPARQTLFFQMVRDGKGPIVGNGRNMRSMAYIDNLAQGLILANLNELANGKVYWIADERPYSMNEIIGTIEEVLEEDFSIPCAHKRLHLPSIASDVAYVCDKLIQGAGFYNQKIHVLSEMNKTIACSVELARRELGYKPTVSLREGMRRSISWMLANGQKITY